jgi:hypothetical protein
MGMIRSRPYNRLYFDWDSALSDDFAEEWEGEHTLHQVRVTRDRLSGRFHVEVNLGFGKVVEDSFGSREEVKSYIRGQRYLWR